MSAVNKGASPVAFDFLCTVRYSSVGRYFPLPGIQPNGGGVTAVKIRKITGVNLVDNLPDFKTCHGLEPLTNQ